MLDWTLFRNRGERGPPALDLAQLFGCVAAAREALGDVRWHLRRAPAPGVVYGLRVGPSFDSAARRDFGEILESRIPAPDRLLAEPVRRDVDLDPYARSA